MIYCCFTSKTYSAFLSSYRALYFSGSLVSPLFRDHVTFGTGSPDTTALKRHDLPEIQYLLHTTVSKKHKDAT